MSLSTLDPRTALVVIDLQRGLSAFPTVDPIADVATRAAELAKAFRRHDLPVVLVNVDGGAPGRTEHSRPVRVFPEGFADLLPELDRRPGDHVVTKRTWGAFTGTDLESHLRSNGVTQVVVAGVSTSVGVESTARHAFALGFNVTLAVDAMTDTNAEAHAGSLTRIFPRLGETGTTREIIALLDATR